jgi:hypothetical protein
MLLLLPLLLLKPPPRVVHPPALLLPLRLLLRGELTPCCRCRVLLLCQQAVIVVTQPTSLGVGLKVELVPRLLVEVSIADIGLEGLISVLLLRPPQRWRGSLLLADGWPS